MGFLVKFLVNIQFFYTFLQETKFLDFFVRAHVIMTSQKPNAGNVGTLFGISV